MKTRIKTIAINPGIVGDGPTALSADMGINAAIQLQHNIRRESMLTCIHEAGHTVAALKLGFRLHWVSIDSNFISTNPVAIEHECAFSTSALTMSVSSHLLEPILHRGRTVSALEKKIVENYGVMVLAGPHAERLRFPDEFDAEGSYRDLGQLSAIASSLYKGASRSLFVARVEKETRAFVSNNWLAIANVAYSLFNHKTLHLVDIERIVSDAESAAREAA